MTKRGGADSKSARPRKFGMTATAAFYARNGANVKLIRTMEALSSRPVGERCYTQLMNTIGLVFSQLIKAKRSNNSHQIQCQCKRLILLYVEANKQKHTMRNKQLLKLISWGGQIVKLSQSEEFRALLIGIKNSADRGQLSKEQYNGTYKRSL